MLRFHLRWLRLLSIWQPAQQRMRISFRLGAAPLVRREAGLRLHTCQADWRGTGQQVPLVAWRRLRACSERQL